MRSLLTVVVVLVGLLFRPYAVEALERPSIEEMAGAMIMVGFHGTTAPPSVISAAASGRLGGIILFDKGKRKGDPYNIESPTQLKRLIASLQAASSRTLLVAVDQEGGKVRRLKAERGFFPLPSAEDMGRMDPEEVRRLGFAAGREMASLGINVNLAPVVDLHRSATSPGLGDAGRLFGADGEEVTKRALAFSEGLYRAGIIPVLKHFPGLGSASLDSHLDLPDVTAHWSREELRPYEEAFRHGWPGMVLVAHVYHRGLDERLPSSLSPAVVEDLLRRRLGWNGVVISDDLQMGAVANGRSLEERVRLALAAGNDILLFGNNLQYDPLLHDHVFRAVMHLVQEGKVSPQRLEQSWRRIQALKRTMASGSR